MSFTQQHHMKMDKLIRPEIFDYLDARQYLNDLYSYRKSMEPGFSFEAWAEELGFRSRSHLRMCLIGKRKISPLFIEKLTRTRSYSKKEQSFWEALVTLKQLHFNSVMCMGERLSIF